MDNNVHIMVKLLESYRLQKIAHSWKSFTAHAFRGNRGREAPIWQEEYFDRVVGDVKEFSDKAQYILHNPVKRWPEIEEYSWTWIKEDFNS